MDRRVHTMRLSLGIPCEIGRLHEEINRWVFSEGLIRKTDGNNLVLKTQQVLMGNELIRINLRQISRQSSGNGYLKPVCTSGNAERYREARVVRCFDQEIDGESVYGISFINRQPQLKEYNHDKKKERKQNERRRGEKMETGREYADQIEFAFSIGIKNIMSRSGCYTPKTNYPSTTERRT